MSGWRVEWWDWDVWRAVPTGVFQSRRIARNAARMGWPSFYGDKAKYRVRQAGYKAMLESPELEPLPSDTPAPE